MIICPEQVYHGEMVSFVRVQKKDHTLRCVVIYDPRQVEPVSVIRVRDDETGDIFYNVEDVFSEQELNQIKDTFIEIYSEREGLKLPKLYKVEEVAKKLGISDQWLTRKARERKIEATKIGSSYRFTASQAKKLLEISKKNEGLDDDTSES